MTENRVHVAAELDWEGRGGSLPRKAAMTKSDHLKDVARRASPAIHSRLRGC